MANNRRAQSLFFPFLLLLSLAATTLAFDPETERDHGNPYVFDEKSFKVRDRSEHGSFKVLERFTERSELLRGIDNYRVAVLEADPKTFILPSYWNAEEVFYVRGGRGTVTLVTSENRESYDVERGDIMRVPAGTMVYVINNCEKEKLSIVMLLNPVSLPGRFQEFYAAGGRNPESIYRSFSTEILETALNTPREKLERLFGQQRQGSIVKASEEQIRALSKHSSHSEGWPFERSSNKPFNLLRNKPSYSNDHGQLHEVDANDYRQLRDLGVDVSLAKIYSGSMMAPNYNSKATKLALVVQGEGEFEMVCPHLSKQGGGRGESQEEEGRGTHYRTVRSRLSTGDLVVIPPGHPVVLVASGGSESLQVLCFGINAENNKKFYLAGKNGVVSEMEREAKELAFGRPAAAVDVVFGAQRESVFLPGPRQRPQQQQRREEGVETVMSLTGF